MVSEEWAFFNVYDKPEAETFILDKILKHLAENKDFDLYQLCYREGLNKKEAEAIKQWQAHGRKPNHYIISTLLLHLEIMQVEEYNRALQIYYNYVCSFITDKDVAD